MFQISEFFLAYNEELIGKSQYGCFIKISLTNPLMKAKKHEKNPKL